ncbi:MAG: lipoate--protein ligase family protein, partial [Candidatus Thorarchaeota archaeon]
IAEIKILGDFFLHPEESILTIESTLEGLPLDEIKIKNKIELVLKNSDATLIGATPSDFAKTIMMAWNSI